MNLLYIVFFPLAASQTYARGYGHSRRNLNGDIKSHQPFYQTLFVLDLSQHFPVTRGVKQLGFLTRSEDSG